MTDIKAHWDQQAAQGELSGTRDRIAKRLEMEVISRYVKDGMRVLDVGCGDGETVLWLLNKKNIQIMGIDYSEKMIQQALKKMKPPDFPKSGFISNPNFASMDIKDINKFLIKFDLIYTERTLINLKTWEEQRQAIIDIGSLLKPGGLYLMCECFQEGLKDINALREQVGLPRIDPPWHNLYLSRVRLMHALKKLEQESKLLLEDIVDYSANYYFLSRVVNAWVAQDTGREPSYDCPINELAYHLPAKVVNLRGQGQLWVWRKK